MTSEVTEHGQSARRGGRRHLDGSMAGRGQYLLSVSVTLTPEDRAALLQIGGGNRSKAVRELLAFYRETAARPEAAR